MRCGVRLIRRLLVGAILLYRRFVSGRLAGVRCSFSADETCSAFGLRIARTASSVRDAIARIVRRLRRCGDACLAADGTQLGWSELHDRAPGEIVDAMRADGEADAAIARILHARYAVARWTADCASARACRLALGELARPVERPRVVASGVLGVQAAGRYRFARRSVHRACT